MLNNFWLSAVIKVKDGDVFMFTWKNWASAILVDNLTVKVREIA